MDFPSPPPLFFVVSENSLFLSLFCFREGKRGGGRETETQRHRETHTYIETDRQTDRERERERERLCGCEGI